MQLKNKVVTEMLENDMICLCENLEKERGFMNDA